MIYLSWNIWIYLLQVKTLIVNSRGQLYPKFGQMLRLKPNFIKRFRLWFCKRPIAYYKDCAKNIALCPLKWPHFLLIFSFFHAQSDSSQFSWEWNFFKIPKACFEIMKFRFNSEIFSPGFNLQLHNFFGHDG